MKEVFSYIIADYQRYYKMPKSKVYFISHIIFELLIVINPSFVFVFWLRFASRRNFLYPIAKYKHRSLLKKYGLHIWPSTKIGKGFYIGHHFGVIIHPKTIIGDNCSISQFTTIGSMHSTPAIIGNNVYIGPGVCIVENVHIGNNVKIGAGAVVVDDIPDNCTAVGVPAKVIKKNN